MIKCIIKIISAFYNLFRLFQIFIMVQTFPEPEISLPNKRLVLNLIFKANIFIFLAIVKLNKLLAVTVHVAIYLIIIIIII